DEPCRIAKHPDTGSPCLATRCPPTCHFGNYRSECRDWPIVLGNDHARQAGSRSIFSGLAQSHSSPVAYRKRDGYAEPHRYANTDRNGDTNRNANVDAQLNNYAHPYSDADHYASSDVHFDLYPQCNINITTNAYYFS
ncbi:MAG: hypothetical protein NTV35_01865, partial [Chloroflexi bacterium]|nr:hypothetical protein [Chloroflexota bacterium]